MKQKITFLSVLIIVNFSLYANIRPNPIEAKGIAPSKPTSVKMESERVVVDLYPDSSVVECHFYMKNLGGFENIAIGFPEMNFHQYRFNEANLGRFSVIENNKKIELIDLINQKEINKESILKPNNNDQPWYLWHSEFKAGETKTIVVRYSLPFGIMKNFSRYFTYILNTGSGWEGKISKSEVVVNLIGISKKQILNVLPVNYTENGNNLSWIFSDFEPTTENDIKIYYKVDGEEYTMSEANANSIMVLVNNKKFEKELDFLSFSNYTIEDFSSFINVNPSDIESIEVSKDKDLLEEYNAINTGAILFIKTKSAVN